MVLKFEILQGMYGLFFHKRQPVFQFLFSCGMYFLNRPFYSCGWSEAEGDLVLIQTFLLFYVNQVIFMLTSIFQEQFP